MVMIPFYEVPVVSPTGPPAVPPIVDKLTPEEVVERFVEFVTRPDNFVDRGIDFTRQNVDTVIEHTDQLKGVVASKIDAFINFISNHFNQTNLENAQTIANNFAEKVGDSADTIVSKIGECMGVHNLTTPALILGIAFLLFKCLKKS